MLDVLALLGVLVRIVAYIIILWCVAMVTVLVLNFAAGLFKKK